MLRSVEGVLLPLGIVLTLIGAVGLARIVLILLGRLKSPLLRTFEAYAEKTAPYNSLRALAIWLALPQAGLLLLLVHFVRVPAVAALPLALTVIVGILAHERAETIRRRLPFMMPAPGWYTELYERTSLIERRRIAYMWLRLPRGLRHHYNQHDADFLLWADQVIVGTFS